MSQSVEQLIRERCNTISAQFLPDLLSKLKEHDIDSGMLLAGELTDSDLIQIGVTQLGVRKKLLNAFGPHAAEGAGNYTANQPQQQQERWGWAQPPQSRQHAQQAAQEQHRVGLGTAAQAAPPQPADMQPHTSAQAAKPKLSRRAAAYTAPPPRKIIPLGSYQAEQQRLREEEELQQQRQQQQRQQQQQGHGADADSWRQSPPAAVQRDASPPWMQRGAPQHDLGLQPAVPPQPTPPPPPASAQARDGDTASGVADAGEAPASRKRRTARSLSAKEARALQAKRRQDTVDTVVQQGWAALMWREVTLPGSKTAQALQLAVGRMARSYTGIDGKNGQERKTLYYQKFQSAHKNQRAKAAAAAAPAAATSQAVAGQSQPRGASSSPGEVPPQAVLTLTHVPCVASYPISPRGKALAAARRGPGSGHHHSGGRTHSA